MRRLAFLLCLALLVSQLGFSAGAMAAAWGQGTAAHLVAPEASHTSGVNCDTDAGTSLPCDDCSACHGCHAPVLLTEPLAYRLADARLVVHAMLAVGHLSADTLPHFKPPIL